MAIKKLCCFYYFWSTFVDNIDVFDYRLSGVNSMLRWTFLHTIEKNNLGLLLLERKVYNNDDIAFFSIY